MAKLEQVRIDASFRAQYGLSSDTKIIGMVAQIEPRKRQDLFLKAAALVLRSDPELRFVLVGGAEGAKGAHSSYEQSLRVLARELGIMDRVLFVGHVTDPLSLMKQFNILVLPSRNEALGGVLIEAMGLGVPVIATRDGGIPEVVEHGITGLLVAGDEPAPFADAMLTLLRDSELARRMGEQGRIAARRFDTSTIVQSLQQCYDDVVAR